MQARPFGAPRATPDNPPERRPRAPRPIVGEQYLRAEEVAAKFGTTTATLASQRSRTKRRGEQHGPPFVKRPGGRMVLYPLSGCRAYYLGETALPDTPHAA